jgi:hypothetical protein
VLGGRIPKNPSSRLRGRLDTVLNERFVQGSGCRCDVNKWIWGLLVTAVGLASMGCHGARSGERYGLGTMDRQKARAADFDPYPLNDIGPEVLGGRPRGFFDPIPEPRRVETQPQRNPWAGYGQVPR